MRIYSRALGAAEIQTDMNSPVPRDTIPPSTPTGLSANATVGSVSLNWNAATDNFGFVRYNVHRGTTSGFTPTSANLVAQPNGTSYVDADLGAGTYYYRVIAEDSSGNVSGPSNQASGVVPADTTPPNVAISVPAAGATVWGTVTVSAAATDNHRVVGVQFRLDGSPLGTEVTTAPFSIPWDTRTSSDGPHILTAVARDPSGNSRTSAPITVTVDGTFAPPDLVAAYGFEEPSGTLVADGSGNGNAGTSFGATRTTAGRFGAGLSFDGVDDRVDLPGLGTFYKSGFTYEAWVRKQSALVGDVAVVGSWVGRRLDGGPMLWVNGARHLDPDARKRERQLPHDRPGAGGGAVAARRRHLRRRDRPLLRRRRPGGESAVRRQRGRLEHVADRRLRARPAGLLRRRHRRGAHLQPRAQPDRDRGRHELARPARHDSPDGHDADSRRTVRRT